MSPTLVAATQKLVRIIRMHLLLAEEPNEWASQTLSVHRKDLVEEAENKRLGAELRSVPEKELHSVSEDSLLGRFAVLGKYVQNLPGPDDGPKPFAALLQPLPENPTPDRLLRMSDWLKPVEAALREVIELLAGEKNGDAENLRLVVKELLQTPVYWWRWTGQRQGVWCLVLTGLCALEPSLLENLLQAVAIQPPAPPLPLAK